MYTILENARIVVSLLKKHNIRYIVLSPGGSNIPIVQAVQQDPFFKCYSVVDERSAMYFAIGLYLQTGEPIATSCTSAQATRNYIPGLTEAYYKHVPILAITMSKHPRYLEQEYMQCPIQTSLPKDAVKKSYSLPCISSEHDRALCVRMANEAMLELTHHGIGPVQLNIEELDNETWVFDESIMSLPDVRNIKKIHYWEPLCAGDLSNKKVMLLIGEHRPFLKEEEEVIERFAASHNIFIYANHTSNYHGKYALNGNPLVSTVSPLLFAEKYQPDILLTIGGLTGDYSIYSMLFSASAGSFEHWRIDIGGEVVDTYGKLTRIYEMRAIDFFSRMTLENEASHFYFESWESGINSLNYEIELPLSNLYAAIKLSKTIPSNSIMNYAILNSLRVWNFMQIDSSIKAFSNVAAFGIDGGMSTALGESVETDKLCFYITGDLAFFYDMNAIGIRHIKNNVRILLVNNNGGMEFKFSNLEKKTDVASFIAADNHFKNAKGWAETNGFEYYSVKSKEEFENVIEVFTSTSNSPIIIELFTIPTDERKANISFIESNWQGTSTETFKKDIKEKVKKTLGENNVEMIKKIFSK